MVQPAILKVLFQHRLLTTILPVQKLHEIDEESIPIENVQAHIVISRAKANNYWQLEYERAGSASCSSKATFEKNDDPVVEVVERWGFDGFGFIVFRTDYSDDQCWEQWEEQFHNRLDISIASTTGGNKIKGKCLMPIFEDNVYMVPITTKFSSEINILMSHVQPVIIIFDLCLIMRA